MAKKIRWVPVHAKYKLPNHELSSKGQCRNKKTGYIFKNTPGQKGYVSWGFTQRTKKIVLKRHFQAHNMLADSFGLIKLPGQIEVDHINRIRHDNRIENLRWATKAQQAANRDTSNNNGAPKQVEQFDLKDNFIKLWPSAKEAGEMLDISPEDIRAVCNDKKVKAGNFKWKYYFEPDLEGEVWDEYKDGYLASSLGRVRAPDGRIMKSHLENGYNRIGIKGRKIYVYEVVCYTFCGSAPSSKHSVDHINNDTKNDCAINLRWATKKEQAENRKNVKQILQISLDTGEVLSSHKGADGTALALGLNAYCILSNCKRNYGFKTHGGFLFRFEDDYTETLEEVHKIRDNMKKIATILQISAETGKVLAKFPNAAEAARQLGLEKSENSKIINLCNRKEGHYVVAGFIFRREGDYDEENGCEPDGTKPLSKRLKPKILQIGLKTGVVFDKFESPAEAERELDILASCIIRVCNNKQKSTGGFIFRREGDYDEVNNRDLLPQIPPKPVSAKPAILQISITTGEVLARFATPAEAQKELDIPKGYITSACRNERKTACGFIFRKEGDYDEENCKDLLPPKAVSAKPAILQICMTTKEVLAKFKDVQEAQKELDISSKNINRVCAKGRNSTGGFIFRKEGDYDEENLCDIEKDDE
uniref:HNH nuclease domain-containing protein n=1 Tax=viral metagenome TaxID=1070528 RepID=A0A6C0JRA7_9ZZZZ